MGKQDSCGFFATAMGDAAEKRPVTPVWMAQMRRQSGR
jgi:hypothetical protein